MAWRHGRTRRVSRTPVATREPLDWKRRASGEKDDDDDVPLVPVPRQEKDPRILEAINMARQANEHICPIDD